MMALSAARGGCALLGPRTERCDAEEKAGRARGVDCGVEAGSGGLVGVGPRLLHPEEQVALGLAVELEVEAAGLGHLRAGREGKRRVGWLWGDPWKCCRGWEDGGRGGVRGGKAGP